MRGSDTPNSSTDNHIIVLLHGFAAHWVMMTRLKSRFDHAHYQTLNWGYNSWTHPIEFHASRLQSKLAELDRDPAISAIHLVTHSMGCIVTRVALLEQHPKKLGRWVMLAPPNRGSHVATSFPNFLKQWFAPLYQLQSTEDSYVNQLPFPREIDIAIVQATSDFIVAEPLTRLPQESDRMVVPGLHSQMLFRQDVAEQTLHFLQHGCFGDSVLRSNPSQRAIHEDQSRT